MEVVSGLEVLDVEFGEQGCALISFAESYSKLRLVFIKIMFCNIWNRRLFQVFHLLSVILFCKEKRWLWRLSQTIANCFLFQSKYRNWGRN